jgi:hypothetical protein
VSLPVVIFTMPSVAAKDENGTEIYRTEPHHFLYLIQSTPHFLSDFTVSDRFRSFSTFLFLIQKYPEFKIRFKPNLVADHYCPGS